MEVPFFVYECEICGHIMDLEGDRFVKCDGCGSKTRFREQKDYLLPEEVQK